MQELKNFYTEFFADRCSANSRLMVSSSTFSTCGCSDLGVTSTRPMLAAATNRMAKLVAMTTAAFRLRNLILIINLSRCHLASAASSGFTTHITEHSASHSTACVLFIYFVRRFTFNVFVSSSISIVNLNSLLSVRCSRKLHFYEDTLTITASS